MMQSVIVVKQIVEFILLLINERRIGFLLRNKIDRQKLVSNSSMETLYCALLIFFSWDLLLSKSLPLNDQRIVLPCFILESSVAPTIKI